MLDARRFTASKYLAASDLGEQSRVAVIRAVRAEEVGREKDSKLVLYLKGTNGQQWPRGIVLNQTNIYTLRDAFGDDASTWVGNAVEIYTEPTHFAGKPTRGIRIRPAEGSSSKTAGPDWDAPDDGEAGGGGIADDVVPFGPCVD